MNGRGSRFKLTRLAAKRNEMVSNGQILSNRKSIEVLDVRIQELLDRIDTNQAPNRLANLFTLWSKMRKLEATHRETEASIVKKDIDDEFEKAYHDYAAWQQMFDIFDLRRKLTESEVKIAKDIQAILTAEDAYELVADIFAGILRAVDDPKTLQKVEYEFTRIVGDGFDEESGGGVRELIDSE